MWAVIPLKSPDHAKSRLSSVLDTVARRDLFFAIARHVITTLWDTPGISHVAVITASNEVDEFARDCCATVISQDGDHGTASAFHAALVELEPLSLERVLMIAGDLPLLTSTAVQRMIRAADAGAEVVIAPDRQGAGTNALLCTPPALISPKFGADSFGRHCAAANDVGIRPRVINTPPLSYDIDTAEDLGYLRNNLRQVWELIDSAPAVFHEVLNRSLLHEAAGK